MCMIKIIIKCDILDTDAASWGGFVGWGWGAVWGLVSTFDFLDFSVETVGVSSVVDDAGGTVGFQKTVSSFDVAVSVAGFGLAVHVVCVWVVYAVFEAVWLRGFIHIC
ncbi:Uncharacterized protein FWK35_00014422 [Aphis craccivora]|uniref:Transmembrane protein n=1 Tax=Aphis craccivora TaxID=307492 RepID=A0A6G0YP88_APHCR|nr:Uncharacterized protein FWK35_00014422 [Aphis craccivora]